MAKVFKDDPVDDPADVPFEGTEADGEDPEHQDGDVNHDPPEEDDDEDEDGRR